MKVVVCCSQLGYKRTERTLSKINIYASNGSTHKFLTYFVYVLPNSDLGHTHTKQRGLIGVDTAVFSPWLLLFPAIPLLHACTIFSFL